MSDNFLLLVSIDPRWQPSHEDAARGVSLLRAATPEAEAVNYTFSDKIVLFDCGANLEFVICPNCDANVISWWGDAVSEAMSSDIVDLTIITPCCRTKMSLADLRYDWPQAFGRFALESMNPNIRGLADVDRAIIETAIGSQLQVIWQHI